MKKFLLSIFAVMLAVFSVQAETKTYTYDFSKNTNWVTTKGGSTAVATGSSNKLNAFYDKATGDVFNAGGKGYFPSTNAGYFLWGASGAYIELPTYAGEKITNVTAKSSSGHSTSVTVGIYSGSTSVVSAKTWSTYSSLYSYDIPAEYQSEVLRLQVTSSGKNSQVVSITITTETTDEGGGETPDVPVLETLATPVIYPESREFNLGESVNVTISAVEGATIHYTLNGATPTESSAVYSSALSIEETTTVKAIAVKEGWNNSAVAEATYTAVDPNAKTATFDFTNPAGLTPSVDASKIDANNGYPISSITFMQNDVTLNTTNGSTNSRLWGTSTHDLRVYKGATMTIAVPASGEITSIEFTGSTVSSFSADSGTLEGKKWTGNASKVVFTWSSDASTQKINTITVTYSIDESAGVTPVAPNAPALPASTTFEGSMMVEITGIAADATVYYTTDESDPATSANRVIYTEPFEITATTTVKAVAVNEVGASDIAEAKYTLVETITLSNCTVAELIEAYASGNNIAKGATVVGYIVGCVDGNALSKAVFGNEVSTESNILLADDPYETNIDNCIPVQLPSGNVRDALNLVDNSDNYQKKVILTGNVEKYFSVAALKSTSAYEFVDENSHTLTVTDAGWATLYLAATARIPSNVEAYTVTAVNDGWVSLTQVTGVIPANTGIIVKANAGEYELIVGETATADVTGNLLSGSAYPKNIEEEAYVLGVVDGVVGLYKAKMTDGVWLNNAYKAYLPASALTPAQQTAAFYGFDWDGTTGIDEITDNRVQSTVIYDLTGRRVETITEPGIYIVGGKKVLVK